MSNKQLCDRFRVNKLVIDYDQILTKMESFVLICNISGSLLLVIVINATFQYLLEPPENKPSDIFKDNWNATLASNGLMP